MSADAPVRFAEGTVDCGCCSGIEWGGEYPRECRDCGGTGLLYRYASGRLAQYRGGPFCGQDDPRYQHRIWKDADR